MCGCSKKCNCDKKIFTKDINYDGTVASCLDPEGTLCPPYSSFNAYLELLGAKLCELIAMGGIVGPPGPAGPQGEMGADGGACTLLVDISVRIDGTIGLFSTVTGGSGNYTYNWIVEQGPLVGHTIDGSSTGDMIAILPTVYFVLGQADEPGITYAIYQTLFKVIVTDTITGCISEAYFMYHKLGAAIP